MPSPKTLISEVVTGLGMVRPPSLDAALAADPPDSLKIDPDHWHELRELWGDGADAELFAAAFENGQVFAWSSDGLNDRRPRLIEWKGDHKPPAYETIPVDLRIDHVYLISCKYENSRKLANPAPDRLFNKALNAKGDSGINWFDQIAPAEYQYLYEQVRAHVTGAMPDTVSELTPDQRKRLKAAYPRTQAPSPQAKRAYVEMCRAVSERTRDLWDANLATQQQRKEMLWRLLRLEAAPYFVLGESDSGPFQIRVGTPWDFEQKFDFKSLTITTKPESEQAKVFWEAVTSESVTGATRQVNGHVEIRWSKGKFLVAPEAKIDLDSAINDVPGYFALQR